MRAAIYARYSTESQREQSIADQIRVAERLADRHSFTVVSRFSDQAISGGTAQRPGYQRMLTAARRREFEVILAEDTSRLWRNLAEQAPRLAELSDLGIAVVTHDLDTRHESAEIMGAVGGAMASAYRKEIGRRTRRGLEGNARNGKSAGGRAFGYVPTSLSGTGQIEIDENQAPIVRRIYDLFVDGHSPRAIADMFNREGIPSPGSAWSRTERRKAGWMGSAIYGDVKRCTGILVNPMYKGEVIWNRSRWIRSAADSSKRRQIMNPRSEWIVRQDESLRIVPEKLWLAVQRAVADRGHSVGENVKRGLSRAAAIRSGSGSRYLLSGLLRCGTCGSAYAISGVDRYSCGGHTSGGNALCGNTATLRRQAAEAEVVAGLKATMLNPIVLEEIARRFRARVRKPTEKPQDHSARIEQLRKEAENVAEAIASGVLRASPTLAARLAATEEELVRLQAAQDVRHAPQFNVERLLSDLPGRAAQAVKQLEETLARGDVAKARSEIRFHVGVVTVDADENEIRLWGEEGLEALLVRAAGAHTRNVGSGGRI